MTANLALCPLCDSVLQATEYDYVRWCPKCHVGVHSTRWKYKAAKADFKPTKTRTDAAWDVLESDVVSAIQKALEAKGYRVLRIGQRNAKGSGTTEGTPDLFVHNRHRWIGVEVKRPGDGKPSPEQQELADAGLIHIVDNVQDALEVCGG